MSRIKKLAPVIAAAGAAAVLLSPMTAHAGLGDRAVGVMPQGWARVSQGGSGGVILVDASFYRLGAGTISYVTVYAHYECSDDTADTSPPVFTSGPFKADKTGHFTATAQINKPVSIPDIGSTRSIGLVAADGTLRGCDSVPTVSLG
jgi:hypothetical protein